jgi:hypothetical protein
MFKPRLNSRKAWLPAFALLLAACAPALVSSEDLSSAGSESRAPAGDSSQDLSSAGSESQAPAGDSSVRDSGGLLPVDPDDPFAGVDIRFNLGYWPETDFTRRSVDLSEIRSGGPPPDGIPAIDSPVFEAVEEANEWLGSDWPVMFVELNGDARAYPLAILIHHEIVNDEVGGLPVALTFCPLCNSTIAFDRRLAGGTVLDFGTTGNLRNSDLVMYDRQTKSWWQQFTGEAIVGELTGTALEVLPSQIIGWSEFMDRHPDGKVLSRDTGHFRQYGRNPYAGYDSIGTNPFLFEGDADGRLPAVERVVAVEIDGTDVAYPFSVLSELQVVNDSVAGSPLAVFWVSGTRSTFGNSGQDTGSTAVYLREVDGELLEFVADEDGFRDIQTATLWNIFGEAIEGPLQGSQLEQVISAEHFWFAWSVFKPDTIVWQPPAA